MRKSLPIVSLGLLGIMLACGVLWIAGRSEPGTLALAMRQAGAEEVATPPVNPFPNRNPAPGLEGGVDWLNTSGSIGLKDLRGKVVLLDFWTYCCINCMHVLPDLEKLERKYGRELVVIGVHSAKFENEKDSQAIRDAILRYGIEHPVINDANMTVWRKYGVRAWPTVALIDPEGYYCGYMSGEGNYDVLDTAIARTIAFHESKGTLDRTPVRFDLEREKVEPTPLRFPGKLLADAKSGRLFISDSNHNRIVITDLNGNLLDIIGSGQIGATDGDYATASFDHPQGMALQGDALYVADTENHLIRAVNLKAKTVSTLAGTGVQARFREEGGGVRTSSLNSPWDLLIHNGTLYVAMAGPHQIWSHKLGSDTIGVFAGSGREDIGNGPLLAADFAQPSGLATDGQALYVCDSEGSAIRRVPFGGGEVTTVAGTSDLPGGGSLFEFGDADGVGDDARLQHPLGIVQTGDVLYVADSYNHKIKRLTMKDGVGTVETVVGGEAGDSLDPPRLSEPAGLAANGETLFIADTNNHRILKLNLEDDTVEQFKIAGLKPPAPAESSAAPVPAEGDALRVPNQTIAAAETVSVAVSLTLPADYKLNPLAPLVLTVQGDEGTPIANTEPQRIKGIADGTNIRFEVPLSGETGEGLLRVSLQYGYCREGTGGLCKIGTARWLVPATVRNGGEKTLKLAAPVAE